MPALSVISVQLHATPYVTTLINCSQSLQHAMALCSGKSSPPCTINPGCLHSSDALALAMIFSDFSINSVTPFSETWQIVQIYSISLRLSAHRAESAITIIFRTSIGIVSLAPSPHTLACEIRRLISALCSASVVMKTSQAELRTMYLCDPSRMPISSTRLIHSSDRMQDWLARSLHRLLPRAL